MKPLVLEAARYQAIEVTAPSRLHFGLMAVGSDCGRRFGGLGCMVDFADSLRLRLEESSRLESHGPMAKRATSFAERFARSRLTADTPPCRIVVRNAPPEHVGLGTGTQLGMSVAAGLAALYRLGRLSPTQLAASVGRGLRSAVGVHGFLGGGLVLESGKSDAEELAPLKAQIPLPANWRFVLIRPAGQAGVHGEREIQAFAKLASEKARQRDRLTALADREIVPAAVNGEFARFSDGLYEFGRLAGECFASVQGDIYASPRLSAIVRAIRGMGVTGVGQSSWGPTLYALFEDRPSAEEFVVRFPMDAGELTRDLVISVASPNWGGAQLNALNDSVGQREQRRNDHRY